MSEEVRTLDHSDIAGAMRLKTAAGWNQTADDWSRYIELSPEGCFGIDVNGTLAATAGAVRYGTRLSWIGMVLTLPEFRGRGYARRLMQASIDYLERIEVEWIKLDATAQGRPVYAKLGFEDECAIERWYRSPGVVESIALNPFEFDPALDLAAFGAGRRELLEKLAPIASCSIKGEGYAMARSGSEAHYFGPCISRSSEPARKMVRWGIAQAGERGLYWDLLPDNPEALRLAREFGFERRRELIRMARRGSGQAAPIEAGNSLVYAIAGFEYG